MSIEEWIRRNKPEALKEWVALEQAKLNKWSHLDSIEVTTKSGKKKMKIETLACGANDICLK